MNESGKKTKNQKIWNLSFLKEFFKGGKGEAGVGLGLADSSANPSPQKPSKPEPEKDIPTQPLQKIKSWIFNKPRVVFWIVAFLNILISFGLFTFFAGSVFQKTATNSVNTVIEVFKENQVELKLQDNTFEINKELPFTLTSLEIYQFFQKENLLKIEKETSNIDQELQKSLIILNQNNLHFYFMETRFDLPISDITRSYGSININHETLNHFFYEQYDLDGIGFYSLSFNILFFIKFFDFILYFFLGVFIVPWLVWGLLRVSGYGKLDFKQIVKYTLLFFSLYLILENIFFFTIGRIDWFSLSMLCFFGVSIYIKTRHDKNLEI